MAAAADEKIKEKLIAGHNIDGRNYKIHLDGYNLLPNLTGKASAEIADWPRKEFFYWNDDGQLVQTLTAGGEGE